ncbi:hypothetical protein [Paraburkholderia sp. A3RO-2L]|uniref:hypothetical protein n=1 Tax=unclassified Paraburkholderia TaxID=2615204 RepID=UPI003DAA3180
MRTPRTLMVAVLSAFGAALLASCSNDPNPSGDTRTNYANTHYSVVDAGGFAVDGCQLKVRRIFTAAGDLMPDFTIAVATCPTAKVTMSSHICGKGCTANNLEIEPVGLTGASAAAAAATTPATPLAPLPGTVETSDRLEREARQIAQARTQRIAQLRMELSRMSGELAQLERSVDAQ